MDLPCANRSTTLRLSNQARALAAVHSPWELVLHIEVWAYAALEGLQDVPLPKLYGTEKRLADRGRPWPGGLEGRAG